MKTHEHPRPSIQLGGTALYKIGTRTFDLRDPYHLAVSVRWPMFFIGFLIAFGLLNLFFAFIYLAAPGAIANAQPGSVRDAFFFSVETMATVGYGFMVPLSTFGHVMAMVEILVGLTFTAIFTGLIFVRFSKVKPRMLFADRMVISKHDGKPTLMLRLAYGRSGLLVAATARIHVLMGYMTAEGRSLRHAHELVLTHNHAPIVALTWTLMHTIDESSPLHGITAEALEASDVRAVVTFNARDLSLGSEIYDMKPYTGKDFAFGTVYQEVTVVDENKAVHVDVRKLSLTEPESAAD